MTHIEIHGGAEACVICDKDGTKKNPTLALVTEQEDSSGEPIFLAVHAACLSKLAASAANFA